MTIHFLIGLFGFLMNPNLETIEGIRQLSYMIPENRGYLKLLHTRRVKFYNANRVSAGVSPALPTDQINRVRVIDLIGKWG